MKPYSRFEVDILLPLFFKCMALLTGRCFDLLERGTEAYQYFVYPQSTCRIIDNPEILQFS